MCQDRGMHCYDFSRHVLQILRRAFDKIQIIIDISKLNDINGKYFSFKIYTSNFQRITIYL